MAQRISASVRLKRDYKKLKEEPVENVLAEPLPSNFLEWRYVVVGPEGTPYEGGHYHGKLVFPAQFPFRPPTVYMLTPNGRFKINEPLCLTLSDYHPEEWNPAWSVSTILVGLLSFMTEETPTVGSIETTEDKKKELAKMSSRYNLLDDTFCDLFPDLAATLRQELEMKPPIGAAREEKKQEEAEEKEEIFYRLRPEKGQKRPADEESDQSEEEDADRHPRVVPPAQRLHAALRQQLLNLRRRQERRRAIRKRKAQRRR